MADTTTPFLAGPGSMPVERTAPWAVNYSSDAFKDLNVELKAAPARSNSATYLTHVTMGIIKTYAPNPGLYLIDTKLTLIDGAGDTAFGPIQLQAQGSGLFSKDFNPPLKITNNKALDLDGATGSNYYSSCFVYIEGFTGDKPLG